MFSETNPIFLAPGVYKEELSKASYQKAGCIFTKSVTANPRTGNFGTTIWEFEKDRLINRVGLSNEGIEEWCAHSVFKLYRLNPNIVLSIQWDFNEELVKLLAVLYETQAVQMLKGIELNISCPNTTEKDYMNCLEEDLRKVNKYNFQIPISLKMPHNEYLVKHLCSNLDLGLFQHMTLCNTLPGAVLHEEDGEIVCGGISGKGNKPSALRCVKAAKEIVKDKVKISACGGIFNERDMLEYALVGADYFQVGTAEFLTPGTIAKLVEEYAEKKI